MAKKEYPNIKDEDWRFQAITTLSKPFKSPWTGKLHPVGTPVKAISTVRFNSKLLSFGIPNATAMFLNISHNFWEKANEILKEQPFTKSSNKHIHFENDSIAFDFFENIMGSIVFAYTALEAFANEEIPNDYVYNKLFLYFSHECNFFHILSDFIIFSNNINRFT